MKKENDPFFSIVVPTYNPGNHLIRLFDSIMKNDCIDQLEIILSDDCSTESFKHIIDKYPKLNIRIITNKMHAGFPRNGREHGANEAKGQWIAFTDQDDYWKDNAFDKIIEFIKTSNAHYFVKSSFIEESVETGEERIQDANKGWTHGKFFETAFLKKYNIHYDYVEYCEDINLTNRVDCVVTANKLPVFDYPEPLYVWRRRGDSLADEEYFRKSIPDHIRGTLGVLIQYLETYKKDEDLYREFNIRFISTFLHFYFYFQTSVLCNRNDLRIQAISIIQPILTKYKEITGLTNEDILRLLFNELINVYNKTRNEDFAQIPFVEQITIIEWMHLYFT